MIRLSKWLLGYICFCFIGGFTEDFINGCYNKKYNISDVQVKDGVLYARCPAGLYPLLCETAAENGGELEIIKKRGLRFLLERLKGRWGILTGAVVGIMLISFLSGFIWNIEVTGNEKLSDAEILSFLEKNGFHEGVWAKSADLDSLENLLLASFDDIAWAQINRSGTYARVEIGEGVFPPDTVNKDEYCNLTAKKDGVIIKAVVYDGWQRADTGDAAVKGDLLISGVYESENGENRFAHARGEYIARVKEPFSLTVNRNQQEKKYIGKKIFKSLFVFGLKIPLYIGSSRVKSSDESTDIKYVILNERRLPLGIITKTSRIYAVETKALTDGELTALVNKEAEKKLKKEFFEYEIIEAKLDTNLGVNSAEVSGYVLCNENIGEEIPLN